jgi:hypothetical protein
VFTVAVLEARHGYRPAFSAGTIAGLPVLGMLIPLLIIYMACWPRCDRRFSCQQIWDHIWPFGFVDRRGGLTIAFPNFVGRSKRQVVRTYARKCNVDDGVKWLPMALVFF